MKKVEGFNIFAQLQWKNASLALLQNFQHFCLQDFLNALMQRCVQKASQKCCETQAKILILVDSAELYTKFQDTVQHEKTALKHTSRLYVLSGQLSYWSTHDAIYLGLTHQKDLEVQPYSHGKRERSLSHWMNRAFLSLPPSRTPASIDI